MKIGEVARKAGLGVETVRFYERQGLIEEPARKQSGYRKFDDTVIGRLRFIKRARDLGFSLPEIRDLLNLRVDSANSCEDVQLRIQVKLGELDEKIQDLKRMRAALVEVAASCQDRPSESACPFLEALDGLA